MPKKHGGGGRGRIHPFLKEALKIRSSRLWDASLPVVVEGELPGIVGVDGAVEVCIQQPQCKP